MKNQVSYKVFSRLALIILLCMDCACSICTLGDFVSTAAAEDAINCGTVRDGENPDVATDCAVEAWKKGQPFIVIYESHGAVDVQKIADAIVVSQEGHVVNFNYYSSNDGSASLKPAIYKSPCEDLRTVQSDTGARLTCISPPDQVELVCETEKGYPYIWPFTLAERD
jgi:hypothetical protein